MTELLLLIARWTIPPCIAAAVLLHILAPMVSDLKAMLPVGFSVARKAPPVDLDREIHRLLDGAIGKGTR
ncbi:hypothetical protein [Bradyrhizobium sp. SBR1B]|uniref:hypothetical protein n=1 Tax=Bradyrhizobium sp. SBR1B TaxID=2663836 RepID=UPI0016061A8F|nr:hypothetical protein [Bradyrhizobium sp. SBR1B]MBB4377250.1 hypothetical protein [Bradyrhizobium sp. SBR1B]